MFCPHCGYEIDKDPKNADEIDSSEKELPKMSQDDEMSAKKDALKSIMKRSHGAMGDKLAKYKKD